jgi:soluble lytic murein transglycosylase
MNFFRCFCYGLCFIISTTLHADTAYLDRFMSYMAWNNQLPTTPSPAFLTFVDGTLPLSQKLREKWLYELARDAHWATYSEHYQTSADTSLQCYQLFALYQQGHSLAAIEASKKQWLTGDSLPPACDKLFTLLFNEHMFDDTMIIARVKLALENRNYTLASYLLRKTKNQPNREALTLDNIQQHPSQISQLKPGHLSGDFYLYGLKRLIPHKMDQAVQLWQNAQQKALLNEKQQQSFLTQVAIYKAMRDKPDALRWFDKIKHEFHSEALLEWRIRFALKHRQWASVESLIKRSMYQDTPCWQYWLARAEEAQGQRDKARARYQKLAVNRQYYGFLSSLRLHQPFQFEHEARPLGQETLRIYKPILEKIKSLYESNQSAVASKLINDFSSELPKEEKSAFVHWVEDDLSWVGKSVYLSNHADLTNQLELRFPLAYRREVHEQAGRYQIPEALIYAIIRQESAFRDDVVSFAGAHGLMQLMPTTALWISKIHHIPYNDRKQLFGSPKNIQLGTAYLKQLANRFHHHPLLMVAAYNAGPRQVNAWLKAHPLQQADLWIELIPFYETRNYLKSVISFNLVYQHRLKQKPTMDAFMKPYVY